MVVAGTSRWELGRGMSLPVRLAILWNQDMCVSIGYSMESGLVWLDRYGFPWTSTAAMQIIGIHLLTSINREALPEPWSPWFPWNPVVSTQSTDPSMLMNPSTESMHLHGICEIYGYLRSVWTHGVHGIPWIPLGCRESVDCKQSVSNSARTLSEWQI